MEQKAHILTNIRWLAVSNIIVKPIWFIFLIYSTRFLGPVEFGKYMYAISIASVIFIFFEGGIDVLSMRTLSADSTKFQKFFSHSSLLKVIINFLVGATFISIMFFFDLSVSNNTVILAAVIYSISYALLTHFRYIFRAFEILKYEAYSILIEKLSVILLCSLSLLFYPNAETFTICFALAYLITGMITLLFITKNVGTLEWKIDKNYLIDEIIKPAIPFAFMGFFMIIYFRSSTLMLNILTGRDDLVGFYNAGYRLVEGFVLFPAIIISPIYPSFVRSQANPEFVKALLLQSTRLIVLLSLLISIPIFLLNENVITALFGTKFTPSSLSIGIICLSMIPVGLTWIFGSLVAAIGRQRKANYFIAVITGLNIYFLYIFLPAFGLIAAAVITLGTNIAISVANIWLVRDFIDKVEFGKLFFKLFIPIPFVYLFVYSNISTNYFLFEVFTTIAIMVIIYFIVNIIRLTDIKRLFKS